MNSIEYTDHIMHHGVKGMKWGVRKDDREATKSFFEGTKQAVESWAPKPNKKANVYKLPTRKIESINRRDRAIAEYNKAHPSRGERAKSRTLSAISALSGITMAAFSAVYLYDRASGTKTGQTIINAGKKAVKKASNFMKKPISEIGKFTILG